MMHDEHSVGSLWQRADRRGGSRVGREGVRAEGRWRWPLAAGRARHGPALAVVVMSWLILGSVAGVAVAQVAAPAAPAPVDRPTTGPADPIAEGGNPAGTLREIVGLSNQMMITFMDRFQAGDFAQARKIAEDMVANQDRYQDTATTDFRAFNNALEKMLYERRQKREGRQVNVEWVHQPIADGHYFLALLAFHEGRMGDAVVEIDRALQWNPVRAAFYNEKGFLLLHQQPPNMLDAKVAYLTALELADNHDDFAAALRGIGFIALEQDLPELSFAAYLHSLTFDPDDAGARKQMALLAERVPGLVTRVTPPEAVKVLARHKLPTTIDPLPIALLMEMATRLDPNRSRRDVLALLHRVLSLDPKHAKARQAFDGLGGEAAMKELSAGSAPKPTPKPTPKPGTAPGSR